MATEPNPLTVEQWRVEGVKRFGALKDIVFTCPVCHYDQSVRDCLDAGMTSESIGFSCIGRVLAKSAQAFSGKPGPCNYAGGGLFRLNPVPVQLDNGAVEMFFAFAEPRRELANAK